MMRRFFSISKKSLKEVNHVDALKIDARVLINPHSLHPDINGLHPYVQLFICRQAGFVNTLTDIVKRINNSAAQDIIFFCDGGKHRSIFLADALERVFSNS